MPSEKNSTVETNINILTDLNAAEIAELINVRAGRETSLKPKAQTIINQFNLINEEIEEGKNAAAKGDLEGVRDAVCDIVLLAYGQQGHIQKLDLDMDYITMCAHNMTRIPSSMEEAEATQAKYLELGIKTTIDKKAVNFNGYAGIVYPVVCVDQDQWDINDNYYPPKKFVKSVNFQDAEYKPIENVTIKFTGEEKGLGQLITEPMVQLFIDELMFLGQEESLDDISLDDLRNYLFKNLKGKRV